MATFAAMRLKAVHAFQPSLRGAGRSAASSEEYTGRPASGSGGDRRVYVSRLPAQRPAMRAFVPGGFSVGDRRIDHCGRGLFGGQR
jgi:hypothetical protein